ncbi:MAG: DUF4965 domain-containing protein [Ruminococcaceae bacterium]|nr:DUF4965 domain-containing protein [Oscillospiraceae bacterium]
MGILTIKENKDMRLRPPSVPLINIDPFFNVWSPADKLTDVDTAHWTGYTNAILGTVNIDGETFRLIGKDHGENIPAMKQVEMDVDSFSTTYVFEEKGVRLQLVFTSPIMPDDLYYLTRPVSYLEIRKEAIDGHRHNVSVKLACAEQFCVDRVGDDEVETEILTLEGGIKSVKMGSKGQKLLAYDADDARICWGYFYLSTDAPKAQVGVEKKTISFYTYRNLPEETAEMTFVTAEAKLGDSTLFTFAYDDVKSIQYYGKNLTSYWNMNGEKITDEIVAAHADYETVLTMCDMFADDMFVHAVRAGGEKYAELLQLAFRQTIAAHKLAMDENGEVLWISKECYSNGCAATVDVSYPSIPLFLLYNPELVKGMMRPIYKFAATDAWKYDFAPHDAGRYPLLNGQVYGLKNGELLFEKQMPVEECGNMLIMEATVAIATGDASFANEHMDVLDQWVKYLIANGRDPENQLCTDDFAGHLAHNCNLTLKAIMGLGCYGILQGMNGKKREGKKYIDMARKMAADWAKRAANGDGSYRLAFDRPGTFSMKYNIVWDKLFGTGIMDRTVIESEVASYRRRENAYGLPLDNRQPYTKSDWLVWTATLAENRDDFEAMVNKMWDAFNSTETRVPMTDWYWTVTAGQKEYKSKTYCDLHTEMIVKGFQNRTVQGGLFIKLLEYSGIMKIK